MKPTQRGGAIIEAKKKMGRPTENPKTRRLEIRLSESENKMLDECAERAEKSRTEIIVLGIELVHKEVHKTK